MPLKPYAHQTTAVYGAMLPQALLRFLLADELQGTVASVSDNPYVTRAVLFEASATMEIHAGKQP